MHKVNITTDSGKSEIQIGSGLMANLNNLLESEYPNSRFVIVTDSNVYERFKSHFQGGPKELVLTVPAGEASKSLQTIETLTKKMLEAGITRQDVVIGIGGGMITDLAGFLASIYMRGLKFVSIPTTLLAMVDASVGGKTGVDLVAKNILGTFHLADYVIIDLDFIKTLPEAQIRNGLGEVIKYGYSLDMNIIEAVKNMDYEAMVKGCVEAKAAIAQEDLREGDRRKLFNYGHTFGHAIESKANYKIPHGECVAIGMCIEDHVARKLGKQSEETGVEIKATLEAHNLPTQLPEGQTIESLADLIKNDKKRSGDSIDLAIVTEPGKSEIHRLKIDELIELAKDF